MTEYCAIFEGTEVIFEAPDVPETDYWDEYNQDGIAQRFVEENPEFGLIAISGAASSSEQML